MKRLLGWATANEVPDRIRALIVFEIAFYFAYRYGMGYSSSSPAPFWFPDAVILCALLSSPRNWWWMYFLAQIPIRFLVAVPADTPLWFLFVNLLNDCSKSFLSALLLNRGPQVGKWFTSIRAFTKYLLVAVLLSPGLSAVAGAMVRGVSGAKFWPAWTQWFLGDALASILLTPALFCFVRDFRTTSRKPFSRNVEALVMATALVAVTYLAFCFCGEIQRSALPSVFAGAIPALGGSPVRSFQHMCCFVCHEHTGDAGRFSGTRPF